MATVTKPMALDESIKTTESTSRNIADVLAQELSGIASAITGGSDKANKTDIATVESGSTASRAYSVGELVYVNGNLYKVKTAISQGSSFTVGTNIELTNVSERINDISAENVSYGSGTVKDALDELTDYKLLFNGNPTTADTFTEFDLDGSLADYRFLIFVYTQYNNTMLSYVEPRALFDTQQSSGNRVYMRLYNNDVAQIYKVRDTRIALNQTDVSGSYKVRIYGFN